MWDIKHRHKNKAIKTALMFGFPEHKVRMCLSKTGSYVIVSKTITITNFWMDGGYMCSRETSFSVCVTKSVKSRGHEESCMM